MKLPLPDLALTRRLAGVLLLACAGVAQAGPLDVADVRAALARGAVAWDVRDAAAGWLPGAVRVDPAAVAAWLERGDVDALSVAVSSAGLNLAGEVVVYGDGGDAGDTRVRQLAERLAAVSRGRVHWLEGGFAGWSSAGLPVVPAPARRWPVPQRLTVIDRAVAGLPADAGRRASQTVGLADASPVARAPGF